MSRILSSPTTSNYFSLLSPYSIYLNTIKFAALSWFFTLIIGFAIAYFLAFHVRTLKWQVILFLICTIPFWTSNIIRMIRLIPVLGRHGLVNKFLLNLGIVDQPIEWLLYSDFAVVLAFVHLIPFMVVPIFNSMMRIDKAVLEAARDAGASAMQVLLHIIIPPLPAGHRYRHNLRSQLGDGDFVTVQAMSGGQKRFSWRRDEP